MRYAAMLAVLLLTICLPATVQADTDTPPPAAAPGPSLPSFPSASDIAGALVAPFSTALTTWFTQTVPDTFGGWMQALMQQLTEALSSFLRDTLGRFNIVTTLPPVFTYNLPVVQQLRGRLTKLAAAVWLLAIVVQVIWHGTGTTIGRSWTDLFPGLGRLLVAGAAMALAPAAMAGWIDFANNLSNALLDLNSGLPGMTQMSGLGHAASELFAADLYLLFAMALLMGRVAALVWVDVLLVVAPFALVVWALPFGIAQRFGAFWLNQFLLTTFAQVFLAIVMALAAGMVTAMGTSGLGDVTQVFVTSLLLAGSFWTAIRLPGKLTPVAQGALPVQLATRVAVRFASKGVL